MLKNLNSGIKIMLWMGLLFLCLLGDVGLVISGQDAFWVQVSLLVICLFLAVLVAYLIWRQFVQSQHKLTGIAQKVATQESDIDFTLPSFYQEAASHLQTVSLQMQDAVSFVRAISHDDLTTEETARIKNTEMGRALAEMKSKLIGKAEEEKRRNWHISGIASLGDELRKHQHLTMAEVSLHFVTQIVRYCKLNQGGVFIINDQEEQKFIELVSCVAYNKQKFVEKRLEWGQSLVGQCILEKEYVYLEEVPANYVQITSGLGETPPRSVLLVPVIYKEESLGVLEVASFRKLSKHEIRFMVECCEIFGSVIYNAKINEHTQKLLSHSQKIAQELVQKEEVLRQNAEELMSAQEELNRQLLASERQAKLTHSIIEAINKTNASIELDKNGNIIDANEMYLSLMEYSHKELIGKQEKELVAPEELDSHRYEMMWGSIQNGSFNSGEFRRINKRGKELWLSATYSPIYDIDGQLLKIIQLGQFTTEQREKELEYMHKVNAMNQAVYYLELSCQGRVISSNTLFQKEFGYKRSEITNRNFTEFLHESNRYDIQFNNLCEVFKDGANTSLSLRFVTKDGREKYFAATFSPLKNLAGEINKLMLIMIDFTRQNELQDELKNLLVTTRIEKAVLELNSEVIGAFADHFSEMIIDLENKYDYEYILYTLKGKNRKIPQLILKPDGEIAFINEQAIDILGICYNPIETLMIFDILHFSCEEEKDALRQQLLMPQLREAKLKLMTVKGSLLRLTAFIAPDFTEIDKFSTITLLITHADLPTTAVVKVS